MHGKSSFGSASNGNKNTAVEEALNLVRFNTVIGCTCPSKLATTTLHLKNGLYSISARELKCIYCVLKFSPQLLTPLYCILLRLKNEEDQSRAAYRSASSIPARTGG
ncbi:uncharacterized protein LOC142591656 [Dermacentor variabilis]|uniref:uncharacterized protein LOC142591656 n=1 Tax=Dermacentor variabilis TaxID=34621 RepID=UPI003F5C35B9